MNIIKLFKRNNCKECIYFVEKNNVCQMKKCTCSNPYISKLDRMFCEPNHGSSFDFENEYEEKS